MPIIPKKASHTLSPYNGHHRIKCVAVGVRAGCSKLHPRFDEREWAQQRRCKRARCPTHKRSLRCRQRGGVVRTAGQDGGFQAL